MNPYPYQGQPGAPVKKRSGKAVLLTCLVVLLLCGAGGTLFAIAIGATSDSHPSPGARRALAATSTASPTGTTAAAPAAVPDAGGADLTAKNITLKVKIASQKCFGSAGCNIEFDVRAGWPDGYAGDYEVTYTVDLPGSADDVTDTLTIYAETGKYDAADSTYTNISHRVTTLKAKVTSVEAL